MAYGGVAGAIMTTVACLYVRPWFWVYRPSFAGSRSMLSFGGFSSVTALMNVGYQRLPRLALGRLIGFDAVGQYNRAATLCQIPERAVVGAVSAVALPALSA
jgi:O-antigen/teichoic acid export membrane protein